MGSAIGTLAGAALGSVVPGVGTAIGAQLGGAAGSLFGGGGGDNSYTNIANQSAAAQQAAAKEAAAAAQFRPVGMTTRFGTSQFTRAIDPTTGMPYVSSAGYTAAPELSALQNRLFSQFVPSMAQAEQTGAQYAPLGAAGTQLMSLGQGYLAKSPQQAAQDYMTSQQSLLAAPREQQLASLRNKVFQTGRGGLGVGGTSTGQGASNPEMQAYYNALANQDLQLAAQAEQAGQQRATFGAGLMGTGAGLVGAQTQGQVGSYAPLQNLLGLSGNIEQYAQQPYQLGMQLGAAQSPYGAAGAQMYNTGFQNAALTQAYGANQQAQQNAAFQNNLLDSINPQGIGGALGGALKGIFGSGTTGGIGGFGNSSPFSGITGYNPNAFQ